MRGMPKTPEKVENSFLERSMSNDEKNMNENAIIIAKFCNVGSKQTLANKHDDVHV